VSARQTLNSPVDGTMETVNMAMPVRRDNWC
jgi:hypothetical protein